MQDYTIFDIETDGLIENVTKIHCLSYARYIGEKLIEKNTITDYETMSEFLFWNKNLVGHNIVRYDIPVLKKILVIDFSSHRLIDSLALSWYLYPMKKKHGLEQW